MVFLAMGAQSGAPFKQAGSVATGMLILPGTLLIGSLFAFPISASLVVSMTWLMHRTSYADHVFAWTVAGPLFSLPASLVLWSFDPPHAPPVCLLFGVSLGLLGGYVAGLKRPRCDQPVSMSG